MAITADENARRVPAAAILSYMTDAFRACGLPEADAKTVAGAMLDADLSGSDAHGIFRLAGYVKQLKSGIFNPRANIKVLERSPATALVDGDNGMGHLVMTYAANLAVELARASGVGWVGVRRSNHSGAGSTYVTHSGGARHGRHLHRGVVVELHGAVGRRRAAARHQSDRGRNSRRQGAGRGARHRHVRRLERTDPHLRQPGQADAGGLGDQPQATARRSPTARSSRKACSCR